MLHSLHIENYVLIDSLDITFPEGLVIITGQTGAGKSILLGALSLLSGGKADAGAISRGKDSCVVEAEFDIAAHSEEIDGILEENDIEKDGGHLIIRRTVNSSGRSRCFVNDSPVTVQVLTTLSSYLIDIHSQHQSLLLTDRKFQLGILDAFAGNVGTVESCRNAWQKLQSLLREQSELRARVQELAARSDWDRERWQQLSDARLRDGELEELEEEQKQLANAELIKETLGSVQQLFSPEEGQGVSGALRESVKLLQKVGRYLPATQSLCERIESSRIEIEDIASTVEEINLHTVLSEERLQAVEERMALLYSLLKKHGCSSVSDLIALRDSLAATVGGAEELEDRLIELEGLISKAEKEYGELCAALHKSRTANAPVFAKEILDSLRFLELDRSEFLVDVEPAPQGATGADSVTFRFSSNGTAPVDVAKCASGGEISRIMLCLKEMMARFVGMPTLIFDEIDTGVSGSVADKMGQMICSMGAGMQVFSITHLPQVAAKGKAHYVVTKEFCSDRAVSGIHSVSGEERVMEIARLLSGSTITDAAIANARALLG